MTILHENWEDIEKFSRELESFNAQLQENMQRLNVYYSRMNETWQDPAFIRFSQEYEQTIHMLKTFLRDAELQIPPLRKRAAKLREIDEMR